MQTFLPYADFRASAEVLDRQRLGKQRVETLQLLKAITTGGGWSNHPAAKMWRGYTNALVTYGITICEEWTTRGYQDTCYDKILAYLNDSLGAKLPPWLGDEAFHLSHRSNLVRKMPAHYRVYWPDVADNLEYRWPV